jgi:hypothetical protein
MCTCVLPFKHRRFVTDFGSKIFNETSAKQPQQDRPAHVRSRAHDTTGLLSSNAARGNHIRGREKPAKRQRTQNKMSPFEIGDAKLRLAVHAEQARNALDGLVKEYLVHDVRREAVASEPANTSQNIEQLHQEAALLSPEA